MNPSTGTFDAAGRGFKPFITNSAPLQTFGDWHRPVQRQSRLL